MEEPIPEGQISFIEDMSVVVVPITRKLLSDEGGKHALDEVAHAIRKNINVLSFMMENDIGDIYENSVFGKNQWIAPDFGAASALPYKDKLKKFCEEHFLNDEMIKSIKDEFSARIFLSYRKKDRAHARPLMKKIHGEGELSDVAIWYDEYLPLAKDYSVSIENEIDGSDAVAFLVTDNLTEEGNYVKTVEYPLAKDMKGTDKIFPLETTGDKELRSRVRQDFEKVRPGFPDYVEVEDISDRLDKKEKEDTPRHKYLIGLAYLRGVDVEKDPERAVRLFVESANGKYIPAAEKLCDMYSNGDGIAVNYNRACRWSDTVVKLYTESEEYGKDHVDTLRAISKRGWIYKKRGESKTQSAGSYVRNYGNGAHDDFGRAKQFALEAIDAMIKIGEADTMDFVSMLLSLSDVCQSDGDLTSALRYATESLVCLYTLIRADSAKRSECSVEHLPKIEFKYEENGVYDGQLKYLLSNLISLYEAVAMSESGYDYSDEIANVSGLSQLFYTKKGYVMSLLCADAARKMAEITGNKHQLFFAIMAAAAAYRGDKQYSESVNQLLEASELSVKIMGDENNELVMSVLSLLGEVYWNDKRYDEAASTFEYMIKLLPDDEEFGLRGEICHRLFMLFNEWKSTKIKGTKQYKNIEERSKKLGKFKFRL